MRCMTQKRNSLLPTIIIYLFLILTSLLIILPLLWIVLASITAGKTLYFEKILTIHPTFEHYTALFKSSSNFVICYLNTVKIASVNMVLSVAMTIGAAYTFSRFSFKGKRASLMAIMVLQMFPTYLAMVAIYVFLSRIHLLDTHFGLILIYLASQLPFNVWLVKGYLDRLSKNLDESAKIDGATNLKIFTKIILPLSKPIIIYVAFTNFLLPCTDWIYPQLILRSDSKTTLAIMLYNLVINPDSVQYTTFAAGSVLVAIPAMILFILLQKYIVQGISDGAVKS